MEQESPPRKPGTFLPGHDPRRSKPDRRKGTVNKIPADIKKGCIEGFTAHGFDGRGLDGFPGYIRFLAGKHPKAAAKIVEKLLPLNITGTGLAASTIGSINVVSIPSGNFLTPEAIAQLSPRPPLQIDQDIVRERSDEAPQLDHESQPEQNAPVEALAHELQIESAPEEIIAPIESAPVETMLSRAALRPPRKPSWE